MSSPLSNRWMPTGSPATAFPTALRPELDVVLKDIGLLGVATQRGIAINVAGESLVIPYRIHHSCDERELEQLDGLQAVLYSCLLTRNPDGHIRQRQLERIASIPEPWVVPFVLQLAGEYVIEILRTIETSFPTLDGKVYSNFILTNEKFFQVTRDRMISYWDCYYRWQYKYKSDYVGYRLFDMFDELLRSTLK